MSLLGSRIFSGHLWAKNVLTPLRHIFQYHLPVSSQAPAALRWESTYSSQARIPSLCDLVVLQTAQSAAHKRGLGAVHSQGRPFSLSADCAQASNPLIMRSEPRPEEKLASEMNMRLVNENSFLSWCRNAYLSTVVGVAMIAEGSTALSQGAGVGALLVGSMNLFWGTGCHITNLIRLRHVSGMSGFTLSINVLGSTLHCLLWAFVLVCYIGFLDETNALNQIDPREREGVAEIVLDDSRNTKDI